jgi:hypothetical protein
MIIPTVNYLWGNMRVTISGVHIRGKYIFVQHREFRRTFGTSTSALGRFRTISIMQLHLRQSLTLNFETRVERIGRLVSILECLRCI